MHDLRIELENIVAPETIELNFKGYPLVKSSDAPYDNKALGRIAYALVNGLNNIHERFLSEKMQMLIGLADDLRIDTYGLFNGLKENLCNHISVSMCSMLVQAINEELENTPSSIQAPYRNRLRQIDSIELNDTYIRLTLIRSLSFEQGTEWQVQGATKDEGFIRIFKNGCLILSMKVNGCTIMDLKASDIIKQGFGFSDVICLDSVIPIQYKLPLDTESTDINFVGHETHLSYILHKMESGSVCENIIWDNRTMELQKSINDAFKGTLRNTEITFLDTMQRSTIECIDNGKCLVANMREKDCYLAILKILITSHGKFSDSCFIIDLSYAKSIGVDKTFLNKVIKELSDNTDVSLLILD